MVRCVYCRTTWQGDEDQIKRICRDKAKNGLGSVNGECYVNVAQELGMTGARGESFKIFVKMFAEGYC